MGESPSAVYYTIQPGGAYVHGPGVRIIYPNYAGLHAGMRGVFWHYDPDHREWYQYGHGAVAPGGRRIVPDPGVRVWEFTGYMYHTEPPNNGPKPCSCEGEGDPVDPRTGLLVHSHTDLAEPDVIPATLTRVYRPEDTNSTRPFGVGNAPSIENYLNFVSKDDTDLIFADGGRIHYRRVSRQDMAPDAVYEAVTTPSIFYHSFIKWNDQLQMWELSLHDGTVYRFPPTEPMVAIADRFQNELTISRTDGSYFIQSITSPNGRWIHPTYFPSGAHYEQIASATDVLGRTVSYGYDNALRLTQVCEIPGSRCRNAFRRTLELA